jgi:hypothetical protein
MANPIYPTAISALILINLLNDFLSPAGKVNSRLAAQFEKVYSQRDPSDRRSEGCGPADRLCTARSE